MFVPIVMKGGEITLVKIDKSNEVEPFEKTRKYQGQDTSLSVKGFNPLGEVLFNYVNDA